MRKVFFVTDEREENFPKDITEFVSRCIDIEKTLPAQKNNFIFVEEIFRFFQDCGLITKANIDLLTDEKFCRNLCGFETNSIIKLVQNKRYLHELKPKNYYPDTIVECQKKWYYITKEWYHQVANEKFPKDGKQNKREFYEWTICQVWKKFETKHSDQQILDDISNFVENHQVDLRVKYLSDFFSSLAKKIEQNGLNDLSTKKAVSFYRLAITLNKKETFRKNIPNIVRLTKGILT